MNKQRHQFAALPEQDRAYILELCGKQPYDDVVALLRKPRSERGLDIVTSKSALCRFYTTHCADPAHAVLVQHATAATIRHEQESNAFLGAIASSIQARVYENLRRGKALADMHQEFNLLKAAQHLYLSDCKWRAQNPKDAQANYRELVERAADDPDCDFLPIAENDSPSLTEEARFALLPDPSNFERDVQQTRDRRQKQAAEAERIRAAVEAMRNTSTLPAQAPTPPRAAASPSATPPPPAEQKPAKSPVIPHIPLNSTKPSVPDVHPAPDAAAKKPTDNPLPITSTRRTVPNVTEAASATNHQPSDPAAQNPEPARVPFVRLNPKVSRNSPCPCGSGLKYKKCCLNAQPDQPTHQKLAA